MEDTQKVQTPDFIKSIPDSYFMDGDTVKSLLKKLTSDVTYTVDHVVECNLNNLLFDGKKSGFYERNNSTRYKTTVQGFKAICKLYKIPYSYAVKISATLLDESFQQLSSYFDVDVKLFIVRDSDGNEIIVNAMPQKKNYRDDYSAMLSEWLKNLDEAKYKFHSGVIHENGFRINYIQNPDALYSIESGKKEDSDYGMRVGFSIYGDLYGISNTLNVYPFVEQILGSGDDATTQSFTVKTYSLMKFGELYYSEDRKFNLIEKKKKKDEADFDQSFKEEFLPAIGSDYKRILEDVRLVLLESQNENLSLWKYFDTYKKLKKVFPSAEQVESFLLSEKPKVDALKEERADIIKKNEVPKVDMLLKTTQVDDCNANVVFRGLLDYTYSCRADEYDGINDTAVDILFDTYNCNKHS